MKSPITQRPTVLRVPQRASGGQARPSDGVDFFYVWHQPPTDEFPTVSEASFEVERIEVNERRLAICTTKNVDEDRLLVTCRDERLSELVGQRVRVEATWWQRNSYDRLPPPCNLTDRGSHMFCWSSGRQEGGNGGDGWGRGRF